MYILKIDYLKLGMLHGEHPSLSEWMTPSDAEFKITFCLFLLGSLLAPGTSEFVSAEFIAPLINLFYLHSLQLDSPIVDTLIPLIQSWTIEKIKICLRRLQITGGLDSTELVLLPCNYQLRESAN
ncbi:hypothetical protein ACOSQ2_027264 [Xanthoceras sorbifolium]